RIGVLAHTCRGLIMSGKSSCRGIRCAGFRKEQMFSRSNRFSRGLIFSLTIFVGGCRTSLTPVSETVKAAQPEAPADAVPRLRDPDDVGGFIAGLPGAPGTPFSELEDAGAWKEHRRRLDDAWNKADGQLIRQLQEFQKTELNDGAYRQSPVFYPFGGPDAL